LTYFLEALCGEEWQERLDELAALRSRWREREQERPRLRAGPRIGSIATTAATSSRLISVMVAL
jgi:hypothetical protein